MASNTFSSALIGWVAIITGSSAILALVFLVLMFAVKQSFGKVNDVFNSIIGISSAVLAWTLFSKHYEISPMISQIALALAVVGAIFTLVGSILILFGFTDFVMAGWYTGLGNALIGGWLLAFCSSIIRSAGLPHDLIVFGLIVGGFMAVGIIGIPGIIAKIDSMESMPWYLYLAFLGYIGTYILYPIWAILLGRYFLAI